MHSEERSIFAKRLERVMRYQKLSQGKLARLVGVSRNTINGWCTGSTEPLLTRIDQLSDALGVRRAYLLGEDHGNVELPAEFMRLHRRAPAGPDRDVAREKLEEFAEYLRYLQNRTKRNRTTRKD